MGDDTSPDVADLALLNEDNAIRIVVNGSEKYVAKDWLEGDGHAANSIFSKQILGTAEGLHGSIELTIEENCMRVFDMLLLWLLLGDAHVQSCLTDDNASELLELAEYFALEGLKAAILSEQNTRDEEEAKRVAAEAERLAADERETASLAALFSSVLMQRRSATMQRRSGTVRCSICGDATTVAPSYRGNFPRCWDCRNEGYLVDDEPDHYVLDDDYW
jgi:hypothetical protein